MRIQILYYQRPLAQSIESYCDNPIISGCHGQHLVQVSKWFINTGLQTVIVDTHKQS